MNKYCTHCGAPVEGGSFCEACGASLASGGQEPTASMGVEASASPTPEPPKAPRRPAAAEGSRRTEAIPDSGRKKHGKGGPGRWVGVIAVAAVLGVAGFWAVQKARISPEVLEDPGPTVARAETVSTEAASAVGFDAFVGNWIVQKDGQTSLFWIQEVGGRYVGAGEIDIVEFSRVEGRTALGTMTAGDLNRGAVSVTLSEDGGTLTFSVTNPQGGTVVYPAARNDALGLGSVTMEDVQALEAQVTEAFVAHMGAAEAAMPETQKQLDAAVSELGAALHTVYVTEGKREVREAQEHLRQFLLGLNHEGFGLSTEYVDQSVGKSVKP